MDPRQDRTASEDDLVVRLNRAEEALRARKLDFQLIVDSIPAQVAVVTPTGEVETLNQPCLEYFGRTLEQLKGWASSDPVHPEDLPHVIEVPEMLSESYSELSSSFSSNSATAPTYSSMRDAVSSASKSGASVSPYAVAFRASLRSRSNCSTSGNA